jgi:hypothetical protein
MGGFQALGIKGIGFRKLTLGVPGFRELMDRVPGFSFSGLQRVLAFMEQRYWVPDSKKVIGDPGFVELMD